MCWPGESMKEVEVQVWTGESMEEVERYKCGELARQVCELIIKDMDEYVAES